MQFCAKLVNGGNFLLLLLDFLIVLTPPGCFFGAATGGLTH